MKIRGFEIVSNEKRLFKDCDMSFDSIEDENGKKVELNNSNYSLYIESKDRHR